MKCFYSIDTWSAISGCICRFYVWHCNVFLFQHTNVYVNCSRNCCLTISSCIVNVVITIIIIVASSRRLIKALNKFQFSYFLLLFHIFFLNYLFLYMFCHTISTFFSCLVHIAHINICLLHSGQTVVDYTFIFLVCGCMHLWYAISDDVVSLIVYVHASSSQPLHPTEKFHFSILFNWIGEFKW